MGENTRQAPKRGSVYIGRGRWVSIPIGSPGRPLTNDELHEAERILAAPHPDDIPKLPGSIFNRENER